MRLTEIFKGTPALFYAVAQEYENVSQEAGRFLYVSLDSPVRRVERPMPSLLRILGNVPEGWKRVIGAESTTSTEIESALMPDSPRAGLFFHDSVSNKPFGVTALSRHEGKTQLALTCADEDWPHIQPAWLAFVDYIRGLEFIDSKGQALPTITLQGADDADELAHIKSPAIKAMVKDYIQQVIIGKKYEENRQTVAGRHNLSAGTLTRNLPDKYKQNNKRRTRKAPK